MECGTEGDIRPSPRQNVQPPHDSLVGISAAKYVVQMSDAIETEKQMADRIGAQPFRVTLGQRCTVCKESKPKLVLDDYIQDGEDILPNERLSTCNGDLQNCGAREVVQD